MMDALRMALLPDMLAFWTFLIGALAAACCGVVGYFLVLRGLSLLGDGISHAVLPGIVIAYLLFATRAPAVIYLGAAGAGLAVALATQTLAQTKRVAEDASLGIVFTTFFALGLVLLQLFVRNVDIDAGCVLFGLLDFAALDTFSWLGLEWPRTARVLFFALLGLLLLTAVFWKELRISSFDPEYAAALGLHPVVIHLGLMSITAMVCVACFEAVGSILVVAMLVAPAATARLMSEKMSYQFFWTLFFAVASAYVGTLVAARWVVSTPGMISTAAGGWFLVALVFAPKHGLLVRAWRSWGLGFRIVSEDVLTRVYRTQESGKPAESQADLLAGLRDMRARWMVLYLRMRGMLSSREGAITLTDRGERAALLNLRAHRLWETYLRENFALPDDHLHNAAERFEHYIGPDLQAELDRALDSPIADPHGKAIPEPPKQ